MANPHRGQVSLEADGKTYTLSFSVNALCELEDYLNEPVAKITSRLEDPESVRIGTVRAIVWAGLRDHHEDLTMKDAGLIATSVGLAKCMEAIGNAIQSAYPDDGDDGAKEAPNGARPMKQAGKSTATSAG